MAMEQERRQHFTLIELLAVITIIAVLAGIVIGVSNLAGTKAALGKCKSQMQQIELALEQYKSEYGYFPQTDGDKEKLKGGYLKDEDPSNFEGYDGGDNEVVRDPFAEPYRYKCPGDKNTQSYDLWSYGSDGRSSNAEEKKDDITNWSSN